MTTCMSLAVAAGTIVSGDAARSRLMRSIGDTKLGYERGVCMMGGCCEKDKAMRKTILLAGEVAQLREELERQKNKHQRRVYDLEQSHNYSKSKLIEKMDRFERKALKLEVKWQKQKERGDKLYGELADIRSNPNIWAQLTPEQRQLTKCGR